MCIRDSHNVEVLMQVGATSEQTQVVRAVLQQQKDTTLIRVVDQDHALAVYRCLFADRPDVIEGVTASQLPVAFEVLAVSPRAARNIETAVKALPGVDSVQLYPNAPTPPSQGAAA